ncbi:MAG TPA: helix-turn-helix transcriptional regulator [Actinomycetota bacterium]|nr:helix-turn-helix transcriptional regulator [Actinomycetota bacterium]
MNGGTIIRNARRRAGISQAELARRLGTKQPVVARWEAGARVPSLESVSRAVEACGLVLDVAILERDEGEEAQLRASQALTPAERLRRNEQMLETEEWLHRARRVDPEDDRARG